MPVWGRSGAGLGVGKGLPLAKKTGCKYSICVNLSLPFIDPPGVDPPGVDLPGVPPVALRRTPGLPRRTATVLPSVAVADDTAEAAAGSSHQDAALRLALESSALHPCPALSPEQLHPALWRANQLGGARAVVSPSGFALLDAQLPGGGWPHGALTELLLAQPGIGELRLLAPALAPSLAKPSAKPFTGRGATPPPQRGSGPAAPPEAERCVMLFDPPAALNAWALWQRGLSPRPWLIVQGRAVLRQARSANGLLPLLPSADVLWALEQALRSGHVGAVLAWLPLNLRADTLRRLQLAAQHCDGPIFIFRDAQARSKPSPAPLRLLLQPAGVDGLTLRLLKRRGPPLAQPLRLQLPPVLAPHQQAQAEARLALRGAAEQAARAGASTSSRLHAPF